MNRVEFRILGPLEAVVDGRPVALGGRKQRALLALLLVRAGSVVSADALIDEVWGADAPATVRSGLHVYLSRLRRLLGSDGRLVRHAHGYSLVLDDAHLDADAFQRLAHVGREALTAGDPARAAGTLSDALGLWRGPALADLAQEPFAKAEAARLEEMRLGALEDRIEANIRLGRASDLITELEALTAAHPYRERLRGQQMLALYHAGRHADALAVYRTSRETLREELGLEPSPELGDLHARILRHDPSLAAPPRQVVPPSFVEGGASAGVDTPVGPPRRVPRLSRSYAAVAVGALLALAVSAAAVRAVREERPPGAVELHLPPNAVAAIDPETGELRTTYRIGRRPSGLAVGPDAVWAGSPENDTLVRIDTETGAIERFGVGLAPGTLAAGAGAVWVVDESQRQLARIDASHPSDVTPIAVPVFGGLDPIRGVAVVSGAAWYAQSTTPVVHRVGPVRNASTLEVRLAADDEEVEGAGHATIAAGGDAVWASFVLATGYAVGGGGDPQAAAFVARVDARTGQRTNRVQVPGNPSAMAVGEEAVWVAVQDDDRVWRLDAETGVTEREIEVAGGPLAIAAGEGGVWVVTARRNVIVRIDPDAARVVSTVRLGARPVAVATGHGLVWVAVAGG